MHEYFLLKPYPVFEVVKGEPLVDTTCSECGRTVKLGETRLRVKFVDDPPFPDAISALDGPEWAASERFMKVLEEQNAASQYEPLVDEENGAETFYQVIVKETVRASRSFVSGGRPCNSCGQGAQLKGGPVIIDQIDSETKIGRLLENPYLIIIRDDLLQRIREAALDVDAEAALLEGRARK